MADQKINALPTKTSPSTGDKMLMIGTAEEYQIDYDQLATAILNKLSTQSFSSLDTTSKTVLGAIDELNSKSLKIGENKRYIVITSINEDLNWGGGIVASRYEIVLINISGKNAEIVWRTGSTSTGISLNVDGTKTIIDLGSNSSHSVMIPIGSIVNADISFTNDIVL